MARYRIFSGEINCQRKPWAREFLVMRERAVLKNKWNLNKQGLDFLSKKSPGGSYADEVLELRAVHSVLRNLIRLQQCSRLSKLLQENMCKLLNNFYMNLSMPCKRIGSIWSWHSRSKRIAQPHGAGWETLRDLALRVEGVSSPSPAPFPSSLPPPPPPQPSLLRYVSS